MKAETINQFVILQFLESKFNVDKLELVPEDGDTIEVTDGNGVTVYFTTKSDSDWAEVDSGIYSNGI